MWKRVEKKRHNCALRKNSAKMHFSSIGALTMIIRLVIIGLSTLDTLT